MYSPGLSGKGTGPLAPDPARQAGSTRGGAAASVPSSSGLWGVRGAVEPPGPFEAAADVFHQTSPAYYLLYL